MVLPGVVVEFGKNADEDTQFNAAIDSMKAVMN